MPGNVQKNEVRPLVVRLVINPGQMGQEANDEFNPNLRILFDDCKGILDAAIMGHEHVLPLC
jgi:hypothetical protein